MRIWVDPDKCQGHTLCNMAAQQLFQLSERDGHASTTVDDVPPELKDQARRAHAGCPERAIILVDD
jgi:ferredoxin